MSVRIVKDYWQNVSEHETLIRKLYMYLFTTRYPVSHDVEEAYHHVLVKLYQLDVFNKFDANRGRKDKLVQKKFEHYMLNMISHILEEAYQSNRRYWAVFSGVMPKHLHSAYHRPRPAVEGSFEDRNKPTPSTYFCGKRARDTEAGHNRQQTRKTKRPTIDDIHDYMAELDPDPISALEAHELRCRIYDICTSHRERKIVSMREQSGLNMPEIAKLCHTSTANVSRILKALHTKLKKAPNTTTLKQ